MYISITNESCVYKEEFCLILTKKLQMENRPFRHLRAQIELIKAFR